MRYSSPWVLVSSDVAQVSTAAQITLLAPRQPENGAEINAQERPLCIINTHLFFHPHASHIRTIHAAAMLAEANALIDAAERRLGRRPSLLFCGDLNSDSNHGISGEGSAPLRMRVTSFLSGQFSCLHPCVRQVLIRVLGDERVGLYEQIYLYLTLEMHLSKRCTSA